MLKMIKVVFNIGVFIMLRYLKIYIFSMFCFSMQVIAQSKVIIISGPSGVGKTTISNCLVHNKMVEFFPTTTTRAIRTGEVNGIDYFFISNEEFESRLADFIQPQQVFGNWYGPDQKLLQKKLNTSEKPILMIVTFNLALKMKSLFPGQVITIFIAPPEQNSKFVLEQRMCLRGESKQSIEKRLQNLEQELSKMNQADYVIINDCLEQALQKIQDILTT